MAPNTTPAPTSDFDSTTSQTDSTDWQIESNNGGNAMKILRNFGRIAAVTAALALAAGVAAAAAPEKTDVQLGVGGKALLYYLPLTIAEKKGFFSDEGLNVTINDFQGGSKSLQALVGGSVDVVTGAYEHTIRMQTKGQDIEAVIELGRLPGMVLAVRDDLKDKVKTPGDLKGMKIGVTSPGSSTNNFANYLLAKDGVTPEDVSFIAVGSGGTAIAAIQNKEIDAVVNLDPAISTLSRDGHIAILADSRTPEGTAAIFGTDDVPAAVLYTTAKFAESNPNTTQALVNALYKALKWLETASPEDVVATVPEEYYLNDKALYTDAVKNSLPTYSRTGLVSDNGKAAAMELLSFDEEIANADIDMSKTFDPQFVDNASKM
jgi:sulfonate transport system substrate-binding protein